MHSNMAKFLTRNKVPDSNEATKEKFYWMPFREFASSLNLASDPDYAKRQQ